jgi:hypothetical protein
MEIQEIFCFIKKNPIAFISYEFKKKYKSEDITIYYDTHHKMKYTLHENKRMYFPNYLSVREIQRYYNGLAIEQDINSPHRYEYPNCHVQDGDIVADIGAAEGFFTLSIIEKASKVYLFECNNDWINALKITFSPWKEKVTIINKYVSNYSDEKNKITLDDFLDGKKIDFIKADIEGAEISLLMGARKTIAMNNDLRIVLCTYHQKNDMFALNQILIEKGFNTEFSKGYIVNIFDKTLDPPYLRRGVIRAFNL